MGKNTNNDKDFFDPTNYKTIIVGVDKTDETTKTDNMDTIELLAANEENREDALRAIKKLPNALELLIAAIDKSKNEDKKVNLIAACWESGIDCRPQLIYFTNLAIKENYLSCIEVLSVIIGMEAPVEEADLQKSIKLLQAAIKKATKEKVELLKQIVDSLTSLK